MAKFCKSCNRPKHHGLCNMVTLSDGRSVHADRVAMGGDLHELIGDNLKIENRWIKTDLLDKKK